MAAPMKGDTRRNNRISISVPKHIADGVNSLAQMQNTSVNDVICNILIELVSRNADAIKHFEDTKLDSQRLMNALFTDETKKAAE